MDFGDKGLMPLLKFGTVELVACESTAVDSAMLEAGGIDSVAFESKLF